MIRHYKLFLFSGFIVFVLPFVGIPQVWKSAVLFVIGGILIVISLSYRHILRAQSSNEDEVFVDSVQESKRGNYESEVDVAHSFPPHRVDEEIEDEDSDDLDDSEELEIEVLEIIDGDSDIEDLEEIEESDLEAGEVEEEVEEVVNLVSKEETTSYSEEDEQTQVIDNEEVVIEIKKKTKATKIETEEKPKRKRGRPRKIKEA